MNADYNMDTTAEAVQKAVHTVTLIFYKMSVSLSQYIKASIFVIRKLRFIVLNIKEVMFILDQIHRPCLLQSLSSFQIYSLFVLLSVAPHLYE